MNDSRKICPDGWEPAQILAYIEGHLEPQAESDLARHLQECRVCALEFKSLGRLDSILRTHPEIFHPDDDELHAFASGASDPEGQIAYHLESCSECAENVRVLREMMAMRRVAPSALKMPKTVEREIQRIHDAGPESTKSGLSDFFSGLLKRPFSIPIFGLASAAAALLLAVLLLPIWEVFKQLPQPSAVSIAEKAADLRKDQPVESQELGSKINGFRDRVKTDSESATPATAQAPASSPAVLAPEPASPAPKSKSALEGVPREERPARLEESTSESDKEVSTSLKDEMKSDREFSARMREKRRRAEYESNKGEQGLKKSAEGFAYKQEDQPRPGQAAAPAAKVPSTAREAKAPQRGVGAHEAPAASGGSMPGDRREERSGVLAMPRSESEAGRLERSPKQPQMANMKENQTKTKPAEGLVPLAPPPSAKASPGTRLPVRILITDSEGRPVPWLNFGPGPSTKKREAVSGIPSTGGISGRKALYWPNGSGRSGL